MIKEASYSDYSECVILNLVTRRKELWKVDNALAQSVGVQTPFFQPAVKRSVIQSEETRRQ
jgi:hypothetical protein